MEHGVRASPVQGEVVKIIYFDRRGCNFKIFTIPQSEIGDF